jgi:hypothetical protein
MMKMKKQQVTNHQERGVVANLKNNQEEKT